MAGIENKKLGIVGGGQLAKMLGFEAQKLGAEVYIYSQSSDDPAAKTTRFHTKGKLKSQSSILKWAQGLDLITYESEFIDLGFIKDTRVYPSTKTMNLLRDRLSQKKQLVKNDIPTSPFSILTKDYSFQKPVVFKQRLFGYDGYGTVICKSEKSVKDFFKKLDKEKGNVEDWIVEDFIPFKRELAVSISRNKKGDFCVFPLVESFQKDSKCFWVKGPIESKLLNPLVIKLKNFLNKINYVGIMAFELFESKNKLIINEIAPRVHNSAHYSIEALELSQFKAHILSIFNQPLPKTSLPLKQFAMVNLIGTTKNKPVLNYSTKSHFHWYGKLENRPGRKMGHITVLSKFANQALEIALTEERKQKL